MGNRDHYITSAQLKDENLTTISPSRSLFETGVMWRGNMFDFIKRSKFISEPFNVKRGRFE